MRMLESIRSLRGQGDRDDKGEGNQQGEGGRRKAGGCY